MQLVLSIPYEIEAIIFLKEKKYGLDMNYSTIHNLGTLKPGLEYDNILQLQL